MKINERDIVEFKGNFVKTIYKSGDFRIVAMSVDKKEFPFMRFNKYGNVSVIGNDLFDMDENVVYSLRCVEEEGKFGPQYKYVSCYRDIPKTTEQIHNFLSTVLTDRQADILIESYPDILDIIMSNNIDSIDYSKLKGIKEKTMEKIVKKVNENFVLFDMVNVFYGILPQSILKKLKDVYKSVDRVKEVLSETPYQALYRLDRTGFKTADNILDEMENAIKKRDENGEPVGFRFKFNLKASEERCRGAVSYFIAKNEEEGSTRMLIEDLCAEIRAYCPEVMKHLQNVLTDERNYYIDPVEKSVTLRDTYNKEKYIIKALYEANLNPNKWDFEYEKYRNDGEFTMTDEQMNVFKSVCENNFSVLTGNGGCVDCDTEFFNGKQWKKISEYEDGDLVLQYNSDGTSELVKPEQYHKYDCDKLWLIQDNDVDMCLSDEHNIIYYKSGKLDKISMNLMKEIHELNPRGFMGKFLNNYNTFGTGLDITDDQIKLATLIALFGTNNDDTLNDSEMKIVIGKEIGGYGCSIVRDILSKNDIKWKENKISDIVDVGVTVTSNIEFIFDYLNPNYEIPNDWYNFNNLQLEVFINLMLSVYGKYYNHAKHCLFKNKSVADFTQWAFNTNNYKCRVETTQDAEYPYDVLISPKLLSSIEMVEGYKSKGKITEYKTTDGYKYCFTVPSHMWIMRRNGIVVVTGNSGKTQAVKGVVDMLKDNNISFSMAAPTARASKVIEKYTGVPASTIHRLLGYGREGFYHNESDTLPCDMVIIDETSMLDNDLCCSLLKAIDLKQTKLLFIGDPAQLAPVGTGNILHDIIDSGDFPVTNLTKIFRYNEGGLIKVTTDIRNCKRYLSEQPGLQNFGDGYVFCPKTTENCINYAVSLYEKMVKKYGYDNVMLLSSQNVGNCGTIAVNKLVQDRINKSDEFVEVVQSGEKIKFKLNDIVIMKKNTYDSIIYNPSEDYEKSKDGIKNDISELDLEEELEQRTMLIANGESGIIVSIKPTGVVIKYGEHYIWTPINVLQERVHLGYCISIHSSQGSQCDNVIIITPSAHSFMNNSNLLYVATSRAKQRCVHIGDRKTINRSVKKKQEIDRLTNTKRILEKLKDGCKDLG